MNETTYIELDDAAEGTIAPNDNQQARLEEFTQRVGSGMFHVPVSDVIPCGCIDGRCGCSLKPNAAGGTELLMVADDLTTKRFASDDNTTASAYRNILRFLSAKNYPIGGHDDEHATEPSSGCGANDKLELIYNVLSRKAHTIREFVAMIGVKVDDQTHDLIVQNATARTAFSAGRELLSVLEESIGKENVDHLRGSHSEVIAIINKRSGTTLDREAVSVEFGAAYKAFNMDVWAFEAGARVISETPEEIMQKVAAMTYYNIATALVLCGKKMRVIILQ